MRGLTFAMTICLFVLPCILLAEDTRYLSHQPEIKTSPYFFQKKRHFQMYWKDRTMATQLHSPHYRGVKRDFLTPKGLQLDAQWADWETQSIHVVVCRRSPRDSCAVWDCASWRNPGTGSFLSGSWTVLRGSQSPCPTAPTQRHPLHWPRDVTPGVLSLVGFSWQWFPSVFNSLGCT